MINKKAKTITKAEKLEVHEKGILHKAVTILIFHNGKVLITKRSKNKFLWPNYWECSCSTDVIKNESFRKAALRACKKELGLDEKNVDLKLIDKFYYKAVYKEKGKIKGYEHEICALFVGKLNGKLKPNPDEISDFKWVNISELDKFLKNKKVSPWLGIVIKILRSNFSPTS